MEVKVNKTAIYTNIKFNIKIAEYDEMVENTLDFSKPIISGVYVLFNKSKVYYVGSSIDVYRRIETHRRKGIIKFNKFYIHPVFCIEKGLICNTRKALLRTEEMYIKKYKPKHNRQFLK